MEEKPKGQIGLNEKADVVSKLTEKQRKYIGILRKEVGDVKYQKIKVDILGGFSYNSIEDGVRVIEALKKEAGGHFATTGTEKSLSDIPKPLESSYEQKSTKGSSLNNRAIKIKDKHYILIRDRIEYFNLKYPNGRISSEVIEDMGNNRNMTIIRAIVCPDLDFKERNFVSHAGVNLNKTSKTEPLEDCETSAIGRALYLMGVGIYGSKIGDENIFEEGGSI